MPKVLRLSARQRLQAAYWSWRNRIFGVPGPEFYAIASTKDMAGRETVRNIHPAFETNLDWRAEQGASSALMFWNAGVMYAWSILCQWWIAQRMGYGAHDYWWMIPGGLVAPVFRDVLARTKDWTQIPFMLIVAYVVGYFAISAWLKVIHFGRSMQRTGLSTEHGSVYFAMPWELASSDPKENTFPPGYDILGGFDERSIAEHAVDFDAIEQYKVDIVQHELEAQTEDLPINVEHLHAIATDGKPALGEGRDELDAAMERLAARMMTGGSDEAVGF